MTSEGLGLGCRWPCVVVGHRVPVTRQEPSGMHPTPRHSSALSSLVLGGKGCEGPQARGLGSPFGPAGRYPGHWGLTGLGCSGFALPLKGLCGHRPVTLPL